MKNTQNKLPEPTNQLAEAADHPNKKAWKTPELNRLDIGFTNSATGYAGDAKGCNQNSGS